MYHLDKKEEEIHVSLTRAMLFVYDLTLGIINLERFNLFEHMTSAERAFVI